MDLKNQGTAEATGTWTDRIYLSQDGVIGGDLFIQDFPLSTSIASGGTLQRTQSITIPAGISGNYRFVVHSDFLDSIEEFDQENNNVSIDEEFLTIESTPSPNLVVDTVTSLTQNLFTDQSATIRWVVKNVGNASTGTATWMDKVYLSNDPFLDGTDVELGQATNGSALAANGSYASQITATLPRDAVGDRYFIVVADVADQVSETGAEEDNSKASAVSNIRLTPPPDLRVKSVSSPEEAFEGESINVTWTIRNQGTGATRVTTWQDRIYLSLNGNDIDAQDIVLDTVSHTGILGVNNEYQVLNHRVLIPANIVTDNAFVIIRTDSSNNVYEHDFEGNNDLAIEHPLKIFRRPIPDLEVTEISPVAAGIAGQPFTVTYEVTNASVITTPQSSWQDAIYLSLDPTLSPQTDILLGTPTRTGILIGGAIESRSYTFNLPDTLEGNFYILVAADSLNAVVELDEANNLLAASTATAIRIDPPDLAIQSVSSSGAPKAGRSFQVEYVVKNLGNVPTPSSSWTDSVYLSTDATLSTNDRLIDQRIRNGVIAAGASEARSLNLVLPQDWVGAGFLIVHSDSANAVYELNNNNNVFGTPITITADRPDLGVPLFTSLIPAQGIAPGTAFPTEFLVENQGLGATYGDAWTVSLVMSADLIVGNGDDRLLASYAGPQAMQVGERFSLSGENVTIPANTPEGLYRLYLVADATGKIIELNESNNTAVSQDFTVRLTPPPEPDLADLQITTLDVPSSANSGSTLAIHWTVRNRGNAPTESYVWNDTVWLSSNATIDSGDIKVGTYTRFGFLNENDSYSRSIDWPIDVDLAGSFFVIVQTDVSNAVAEGLGELNNKRVASSATLITLSPTPDLRVVSVSPPSTALAGRQAAFSWQVTNSGANSATPPWTDRVYLSLDQVFDPASDISIGYVDRKDPLGSGMITTVNSNLSIPKEISGDYFVIVATDATDLVYERQNESNNITISETRVSVTPIPPADLVVTNISSPTSGVSGERAEIVYTVANMGANRAVAGWYDSVYLSADDQWDVDDAIVGVSSEIKTCHPMPPIPRRYPLFYREWSPAITKC